MSMPLQLDDTIAALASAPGPAARGIVRISGPDSKNFLEKVFQVDIPNRWKSQKNAFRHTGRFHLSDCHVELPLDLRQFGGSALTDDIDVPKDGVGEGEDIPVTYVPARNLVFLALTTAFAETSNSRDIFIGVNALDYSGYPDCRPEFIAAFAEAARLGTKAGIEGGGFAIDAPLQFMSKADIASEADRLGLDTGLSWSCYDPRGDGLPCGLCDSCRLRLGGFAAAGLEDGLTYPAR